MSALLPTIPYDAVATTPSEPAPLPLHVPVARDRSWANWAHTASCRPALAFYPRSAQDLCAIMRYAHAAGRRVRAVGSGHAWSALVPTSDILVSMERLDHVAMDLADPARPRVIVGGGATVRAVNTVLERHGYALPFNVVLESVRFGGLVATGSHGSGWANPTLSDLVHAIEIVDATGALRRFEAGADPDEVLQAARLHLGMFGLTASITLDVQPTFNVRVVNRKLDMRRAMEEVADTFAAHDYAQYFWFPFNREVTLQTSDVTDEAATWTGAHQWRKDLNGWMETGATHLVKPLLVRFPQLTPHFTRLAGASLKAGEHVMRQSDNMLLGRWINSMVPSLNASVSFPPGPRCERVREAWQSAVDLIDAMAGAGKYPVNLAMNTRLFGKSTALLHTIPGAEHEPTCNIQITSFDNQHWEEYKNRLMERWLAIPGSRPHWAKQYQDLPQIASRLRAVYGENLETFLRIREAEGVDPDNIFVNPFLERLAEGRAGVEKGRGQQVAAPAQPGQGGAHDGAA